MSDPANISPQNPVLPSAACWSTVGVWGDGSCDRLEPHVHCRNCPVFSAAAAQLLDRNLPAGHLAEWSSLVAQVKPDERRGLESIVIFRVGLEWLALPTAVFEEVAGLRAIHSLPHRGGAVLGVTNIRGSLLVCVSLQRLLNADSTDSGSADRRSGGGARLLVIACRGNRAACPVDEVHGVQRYEPRELAGVPATVAKGGRTFTRAVLPWRDHAVGLLDETLLFEHINRSLVSASAT